MRKKSPNSAWAIAVCFTLVGCSGDDETESKNELSKLGKPCTEVMVDETEPTFSGYGVDELNLDCGASECRTSVGPFCLTYHFRGRVTCPYGQTESDTANLPATDPARCRVPRADGSMTTEPVQVAVIPQLAERRPEKTVYYTCACSGNDSTREYCSCPTAMHCEAQAFTHQLGITGLCVRDDSAYEPTSSSKTECSISDTDPLADCGNNRQNP
jgi:hypothetical protein